MIKRTDAIINSLSNSPFSPLYSSDFTMSITLNGQLLLTMCMERILEEVPECIQLMANTDGFEMLVPVDKLEKVRSIYHRWEKYTQLELEECIYKKMIILNVSNYIAIKEDGSIKRKGTIFIYKQKPGELELYKNHSSLVIQKALEAYFVNNTKPEEFILSHNDIYDFFLMTNIKKSDCLVRRKLNDKGLIVEEEPIQRISRYIISGSYTYDKDCKCFNSIGEGYTLIKILPPLKGKSKMRESNIQKDCLCTIYNDLTNISEEEIRKNIFYDWYIEQVYNVIKQIEK